MRVWLLLVLCLAGSATAAPTEEEEVFVEELLTEEPVVEVSQEQPDEFLQPEYEAKCIYKIKRQESGRFNQEPEVGANPVQIEVGEFDEAIEIVEDDVVENACLDYQCKKGKVCELDESNTPMCVCQDPTSCPPAEGEFEHVCGTDNKTYDTSCHFFATKCALEGTKKGHKLHLDYVGPCKFIEPCVDAELLEFPLRMRDWLKNVLVTLYERDTDNNLLTEKQKLRVKKIYENEKRLQAGEHSLDLLAHDFKKNYNMYIFPVHWQFGQLDQHPADGYLTHSELSPLRAPLIPMEHCTTRFFEECDADSDNYIALEEWAACFGVKEQDIDKELII